ncbi:protease modulator HflK [Luteolibacter pohnpeiensis]|uniref:Protease modulator HflK n=1 Tax=Luteolibacter pohnpeiensis TaxID=454153 RepID=A0A934VVZ6_9BACT|nr:protease modulator HflK [Luteolibacter pohnpeiensis]
MLSCYAIAFTACAIGGEYLAQSAGLAFFRTLAMLLGWISLVAISSLIPPLRFRLRPLLLALGTIAVVAVPGRFYFPRWGIIAGVSDERLKLIAVVLAVITFILHFLATYGSHSRKESPHIALDTLVPLARLAAAALAVAIVVIVALLFFQKLWIRQAEILFGALTFILITEEIVRAIARLYLPKRLRRAAIFGHGLVLPSLFGQAGPLASLSASMESAFGVKLGDTWLIHLAKKLAAPLILLTILGLWAGTGVTRIAVDSQGVLSTNGFFQPLPLKPGLHFHAPWPWGQVTPVVTGKIEEISLGFERDLSGPILWAEKHFEGEQNLLVGGGEELLTVNVPVHYRIRDAVSYLTTGGDPRTALTTLGYHELLRLTPAYSAFDLMTSRREEVASLLKARLQTEVDRLGLGIEIVFVGFKDVHPPVEVAPAYQDVVSAEEQRLSLIDQAHTASVTNLSEAHISALQATITSQALAEERVARAEGESSRFLAPAAVWQEQPEVYATRLRLEAIENALSGIHQLYLLPAGVHQHSTFLFGNTSALAPTTTGRNSNIPAPVIRPANPVIKRTVTSKRAAAKP